MRNRLAPLFAAMVLPLCLPAQQPAGIEAVRSYALNYLRSLPDYTCSQVTQRVYTQGARTSHDTVEEELNFVGGKEHYVVKRVNGFAPPNQAHEKLKGPVSEGEFGSLLRHIFDPDTGTTFRAEPAERLQGRVMRVFSYRVPQKKGYSVIDGEIQRELLLPYEGSVWVDPQSNAVMRITMKCVDIPLQTRLAATEMTIDYKPVPLAGQSFVLPSQVRLSWRKRGAPRTGPFIPGGIEEGSNEVEFKGYRKFTAESNIDFGK